MQQNTKLRYTAAQWIPPSRPPCSIHHLQTRIHPCQRIVHLAEQVRGANAGFFTPVHDPDFRQSERDWHAFVDKVTERLIEIDDTVPELPVKDVVSIPLLLPHKPNFQCSHHET